MKRSFTLLAPFAAFAAFNCAHLAYADKYPSKPVHVIVPFAAGGANDVLARLIAKHFTQITGQAVVVEDRPGAGGTIAGAFVARSAPDGYTILLGSAAPLAVAPKLYMRLPYNVQKDLVPITLISRVPDVLVVNPAVPVKSVSQLIAYAKAHPGKLMFASSGNGGSAELAGDMLDTMAGIRMRHIPFKGTAPAITALLGAEVQVGFPDIISALPVVRSGKLRALGVTTTKPAVVLPSVPPIARTIPGYETGPWYAVVAPAGTPAHVVRYLHDRIVGILHLKEVRQRLIESGSTPIGSTPKALAAFIKAETARVGNVIAEAHIPRVQ